MTPNQEIWFRVAEVFGIWTAAIATFYAARTALKIASNQSRRKIDVKAGGFSEGGVKGYLNRFSLKKHYLLDESRSDVITSLTGYVIVVRNTGQVPVVLEELGFTHFLMRGWRTAFELDHAVTLQPGESEHFRASRPTFTERYFSDGNVDYPSALRRLIPIFTFARVRLASGEVFKSRVSEPVRETLWSDMKIQQQAYDGVRS